MGLQLDCPLCCSETFSCHNSLKYHLLSVVDNLLCPACHRRFDNVFELAMHLGRQCNDEVHIPESNFSNCAGVKVEDVETQTESEINACTTTEEANELQNNGIDLCVLSKDTPEIDAACPTDQYYCSTCKIHFASVQEHVQNFHSGEEVMLAADKGDSKIINMPMNADSDSEESMVTSIKSARLLDTIKEEDCVDKDGRLYIRKVVKIEKFWDDAEVHNNNKDNNKDITKLQFAINQNGVLQKLTPDDYDDKVFEIYECSKCEIKFLSDNQYYKHKCYGGYKTCYVCKAHFVDLKFLEAHLKIHHPKESADSVEDSSPSFICEVCNTSFSTSKSLRLHRRMHEPVKSKLIDPPVTYGRKGEHLTDIDAPHKMFLCQICNKSYNIEYEDAHNQFHNKEADFNCEICNRKFYTHENLQMHLNAHAEVKKFLCPNCKKAFLTEEKLLAHKSSLCEKRLYECQYCGRRFARPHEKVKHERIHTGEKPHVCAICGKAFRVSYCLTLHMRTHTGTRPYHCELCGKRFKAHSVFSHHLLTHSNDRKYKCTFCPKTFKTGVQLAGHKNSHVKPFNCTECNRPFASLYAVRAHMETHQRQNNLKHSCWLCGASYARAFALRDHFKQQHIEDINRDVDIDAFLLEPEQSKIPEVIEHQDVLLGNVGDSNVGPDTEMTHMDVGALDP